MLDNNKTKTFVSTLRRYGLILLVGCLALSGTAAGQDPPTGTSTAVEQMPLVLGVRLNLQLTPAHTGIPGNLQGLAGSLTVLPAPVGSEVSAGPAGVRRITLDEAKQLAAGASNPLVRLGALQVEAAKQHRLGAQSDYFPKISSTFFNLHYNKHPGEVLALRNGLSVPVNIVTKDETVVNVSVVQPVTPLFQVHQLVKLARADENIARAKAGMPVAEMASRIEKTYFALLVADRELIIARAEARKIQGKWLRASTARLTSVSTEQETDMISAEKAVFVPASKVRELTASLDEMLGLPEGTRLELVPPEPLVEDISLHEVAEPVAANPEIVEAEQTAIKARAGLALAKMEYMPTVAVVGGYANQNALNVVAPRDFSYIGVMASWNVFDFGKRERGVKERDAQVQAAELAVTLTKAKAAAAVKNSRLELDRARTLSQLAHRMSSALVVEASYSPENPDLSIARARIEAEMFRAELEYRQAYAKLKVLMGAQCAK